MQNLLCIGDLLVLTRLFAEENQQCVLYDPDRLFEPEPHPFYLHFLSYTQLLHWLRAPSAHAIFLVNLSTQKLNSLYENEKIMTQLQWHPFENETSSNAFAFINNPDGGMRWIFPHDNPLPSHLELYNASGWKATTYKRLTKTLFRLGQQKILFSGTFFIRNKKILALEENMQKLEYEQYSIFTGTPGVTRKAIVEISKNGQSTHFLKLAISMEAGNYLRREIRYLNALNTLPFQKIILPKAKNWMPGILLQNIKPERPIKSLQLNEIHFAALEELYQFTSGPQVLQKLPIYEKINEGLYSLMDLENEIKEPLPVEGIYHLIHLLLKLVQKMPGTQTITVATAHCDFTPWNMYLSEQHLHLYDWELTQEEIPVLFDAFHFVFQTGVLIQHLPWESIAEQLNELEKSPFCQNIIQKYKVDFNLHLRFYMLYTCTYYLPKYLAQKSLHAQAFWLIDIWEKALMVLNEEVVEEGENIGLAI